MDNTVVLAKAIYDNEAETKDELQFRRGDIVTVLEQNTDGLEGWWLCSMHGRQGIAPGNRLRILPGTVSASNEGKRTSESAYDVPPTHAWMNPSKDEDEEYDVPRQQVKASFLHSTDGSYSPSDVYDVPKASVRLCSSFNDDVYDTPTASLNHPDDGQDVYNVPSNLSVAPDPRELYDVPPLVSRDFQPNDVYDIPPRRQEAREMIPVLNPEEVYDVPPSSHRIDAVGFPSSRHQSEESDVVYDIPQSNRMAGGTTIPSGLNSLRRMKKEMKESIRIATEMQKPKNDFIYDVPPLVSRDRGNSGNLPTNSSPRDVVDGLLQRLSLSSDVVDAAPTQNDNASVASRESFNRFTTDKQLPQNDFDYSLEDGLKQLISLKQNLEDAVSKLLTLVKENWRKAQNIAGKVHELQKFFVEVLIAVNEFFLYARGATANACVGRPNQEKAPKQVQVGLQRMLVPIEEDLNMLRSALSDLDNSEWSLSKLAVDGNAEDGIILDEVDSFVMTSRAVSDDASQMAVYLHTHAQYIFKKEMTSLSVESVPTKSLSSESIARPVQEIRALQARPLPAVPPTQSKPQSIAVSTQEKEQEGWLDDYDYVALPDESEPDEVEHNSGKKPVSMTGLNKRKTQLLSLEKEVSQPRIEVYNLQLQEKEILKKLEIDVPDLITALSIAIDNFIKAVDSRKPPPSFVALGKHVILCAHKLVFVGDCIHQHVSLNSAKQAMQEQCAAMCGTLKKTVASTKHAALQWPSVSAMQDMVDKMFEIATCAHQIRLTLNGILSNS